jgi:hypothetical protein
MQVLELQSRRLKGILCIVSLALGSLLIAGFGEAGSSATLRARRLQIVGSDGQVQIELRSHGPSEGGSITLYDAFGGPHAELAVSYRGSRLILGDAITMGAHGNVVALLASTIDTSINAQDDKGNTTTLEVGGGQNNVRITDIHDRIKFIWPNRSPRKR